MANDGERGTRTFVITRFDPDKDQVPKTQSYEVPCRPEWKVLDALNFIKDEIDPTLSHRWSCRMAVCGSCGMNVDGEPKLTCKTSLADYGDTVEVAPLANFPVIRDLVIEMDGFMEKFKAVKPWIIVAKEKAAEEGTYQQSPAQLAEFKQFSMCINCMLCYAACPVVAKEPDFLGPAAIALGHRYNMDSRDEGAARAQRDLPRRGNGLLLLVRERVQRGLPEERRSRGGREPGEAQRGDRLGHVLRREAGEVDVAPRRSARHDAAQARQHAHRAADGAGRFLDAAAHAHLSALRRDRHRLPARRPRRAARGVGARRAARRPGTR